MANASPLQQARRRFSLVRGRPAAGKGVFVLERSLEQTILIHLRANPGQRFTRSELVWRMKTCGFVDVTDRQVRKAIEDLRANHSDGPWICSSSEEPGYFWATTEGDIEAAQAEDLSRMQATGAKVENRRRLLQRLELERVEQGRLL